MDSSIRIAIAIIALAATAEPSFARTSVILAPPLPVPPGEVPPTPFPFGVSGALVGPFPNGFGNAYDILYTNVTGKLVTDLHIKLEIKDRIYLYADPYFFKTGYCKINGETELSSCKTYMRGSNTGIAPDQQFRIAVASDFIGVGGQTVYVKVIPSFDSPPLPEPGVWLLNIVGFGLVGSIARSRRQLRSAELGRLSGLEPLK